MDWYIISNFSTYVYRDSTVLPELTPRIEKNRDIIYQRDQDNYLVVDSFTVTQNYWVKENFSFENRWLRTHPEPPCINGFLSPWLDLHSEKQG